jgi:hypothetical protein
MLSGGVKRPLPTTLADFPSTRVTVYSCCVFCRNATGARFLNLNCQVMSALPSPFLSA